MRSGWRTLRASVACGTVRLTDTDQRELETAIAAHLAWLTSQGVELPNDPERLTAIDAFSVLEDAKAKANLVDPSHGAAVLRSLMALCALRTRAVGVKRVRAVIEEHWTELAKKAKKKSKPQVEREKSALLAVHDDTQLKVIEQRAALFQKNARSLL